MTQVIVETIDTRINSLTTSQRTINAELREDTYKVVKFMVKVKFMEKIPNKPFGRVRVRKVTVAYRTAGMKRKKKLKIEARMPAIVDRRETRARRTPWW